MVQTVSTAKWSEKTTSPFKVKRMLYILGFYKCVAVEHSEKTPY